MKSFFTWMLALIMIMSLAGCRSSLSESLTENRESQADGVATLAETEEPTEGPGESAENTESLGNADALSEPVQDTENTEETEGDTMKITVGDTILTVTLADNSSAEALVEILEEGPLTIDMSDYGSMEKVGPSSER
ncbi:MAG: cyclophilin-like fold protein [Eubacteriales bacterium]|nr:cyclophilin-like fold protein [Eubacteriales bacterium]